MLRFAALAFVLAACAASAPPSRTVELRLIAFNDFHGHIETAPALATALHELQRGHLHTAVVAAGDLVGASPLPSALFGDEPAVKALSEAGLELSAAGNHEFDHGRDALLRLQRAARFHWLAANVFDSETGRTLLPAYEIREYEGIRVAFVGAVLRSTPQVVMATGVRSLDFRDEADSVNALVPAIQAAGVEAMVLLVHQGGRLPGRYDDPACPAFDGPILDIVRRLDPAIDIVVSGHTHEAYACRIAGRLVTSASAYGRMVATIDVTLDRATRDVADARAELVAVDSGRFRPDAAMRDYVDAIAREAAPLTQRRIGVIHGELSPLPDADGQSPLGRFVANAQLAAMREAGARIAFVDPGGLRAPLRGSGDDGHVTYGDLHAAQPFGNPLVAMTLTGSQLARLLEEQWRGRKAVGHPRLLSFSDGFDYRWDDSKHVGHRVVTHSMKLDGLEILPERSYRIVVNSFIAEGGGGYAVLREGADRVAGPLDIEALERYVLVGDGLMRGP